ncbi:hypothetical protein PFISCL1PPCAC_1614 [Pristionchus fissidentatus]|uniref:Palmitoyl-protein thioesterase 1 n=1 Tax=Pristionchus fissidentatus TaxID=1538716 RepID=A0AAV5UVN0_9BILA|nr:hypothetical protein PFISCL1PPCAC_1614 [Pristionchus fissidentatus]
MCKTMYSSHLHLFFIQAPSFSDLSKYRFAVMKSLFLLLLCLTSSVICTHKSKKIHLERKESKPLPVVIWHGMGDSCCNPLSMGAIKKHLEEKIPGVYVHSLRLGNNFATDTKQSFFANMNELVAIVCLHIMKDPELQNGYNAIGFSQGALFLRALAQRCAKPKMNNLISIGGPQNGIFGLPYCLGDNFFCNSVRWLLEQGAYEGPVQRRVVQAQYWHDPNVEETYLHKSIFLADINNEKTVNHKYKENLIQLKNFVLVKFDGDHMVVPKESEWFGYYAPNDQSTILAFNETRLYKEDLIGLKTLHDSSRLHFLTWPGEHLRVNLDTLDEDIIQKFLT